MRRLLWGSLLVVVALLIWQTLRPLPSTMKNDYAIELGERELAPKVERLDEGLTARFRAQLLEAELLEREDLLANRLKRFRALAPESTLLPVYEIWLALRENREDVARAALAHLQRQEGESPLVVQLDDLITAQTRKRGALQQARVMALAGRSREALRHYAELFPNGFALISTELEYLRVLAQLDGRRPEVIRRLESLNRQYPDNGPLQYALADQLMSVNVSSPRGQSMLRALLDNPSMALQAAYRWSSAMQRQPITARRVENQRLLAERFPDTLQFQQAFELAQDDWQAERQRLRDPYYRAKLQGLALLDQERNAAAQQRLNYALKGRPQDAEILGGLGLLALRRGEHSPALNYFQLAARYNKDPDQVSRWESLITTTRYWQALRRGEAEMDDGRYEAARQSLLQALALKPDAEDARLALAQLSLRQGGWASAERYYDDVLRRDPGNTAALWGRFSVIEARDGDAAAVRYYRQLSTAQQQNVAEPWQDWQLARAERELAAAERVDDQLAAIERLLALAPSSPWLRSDIASRLRVLGQPERADRLMAQWADDDRSPDMQFSYALYLASQNRIDAAAARLEAVPSAQRSAAMQRNLARWRGNLALADGDTLSDAERGQQLRQLEQDFADQPDVLLNLAGRWIDLGEPERARRIVKGLEPVATQPFYRQLEIARLWLALDDFQTFSDWHRQALGQPLTPEQRRTLNALSGEYELALGRHEEQRGKAVLAWSHYRRAAAQPGDHQLDARIALLRLSAELDNSSEFDSQSAYLMAHQQTLSDGQLLALAEAMGTAGQPQAQRQLLTTLLRRPEVSDQSLRSAMQQAEASGDWAAAENFAYAALQKAAGSPQLKLQLSKREQRALYSQADRNYWLSSNVLGSIDRYRARRQGHLKVGFDLNDRRSGTRVQQIPVELRWPVPRYDGHLLVRVDRVTIDSGREDYLDSDGAVPPSITRIPFSEKASGTAVGVGWQAANWQADIGSSPLGFKVSDWVGGVTVNGDLGQFGWRATLSRRPETGTALSYAGMTVPGAAATGADRDWGGVIRSGAKLGFSHDLGGKYGFWSSLQYHLLQGDDVENNTRMGLLGGVYRRLLNEPDRTLRVGVNVMHLRYDKNLSEYSLGHGAYYSPQQYLSLSLPVRYYGRVADSWSYLLGASLSHSWTQTDAPYRLGGSDGDGGGAGYYLEAAIEKRVTRRWFVGVAADIHRADFYEPNHIALYLKYQFDERWQLIETPPEAPIPYSDFD